MARIVTSGIALLSALLAIPAAVHGQEVPAPPEHGQESRPEPAVVVGRDEPEAERPRALGDALSTLHSFLRDQGQTASALTMNPSSVPVAEFATNLADDFSALELELNALGQRMGMDFGRRGPLGATETARSWAHEQRRLELESLAGSSRDTTFLSALPQELRFGLGLVNAAKLSGTLDPEVLRFLNDAGLKLQSYLEQSRGLLGPRLRLATSSERSRG